MSRFPILEKHFFYKIDVCKILLGGFKVFLKHEICENSVFITCSQIRKKLSIYHLEHYNIRNVKNAVKKMLLKSLKKLWNLYLYNKWMNKTALKHLK